MKISIITATYNSIESLPSVFQSISEQDYDNIEWIIIDGDSKDGTVDYIKSNETIVSKWISEPDKGIYDALNKGIEMATGDVLGFLHSDDFFASSDVVSAIANTFNNAIDGVYGDLQYVHATNIHRVIRSWKSKPFKSSLIQKGWMPAHPTFFLKRRIYEKYGKFDTSFRIAADYDFMLRILSVSELSFSYLPKTITKMRVGGISNSTENLKLKMKEDLRAMSNNNISFLLLTLLRKNLTKIRQFIKH